MKLVLTEEEEEPLEWLFEHLDLKWIRHPVVKEVLIASLDAHADHKKPETATILSQCHHAGAEPFITEAVTEARDIPSRDRQYEELVRRLRDKFIDHEIILKKNLLSTEGLSDEEQLEITRILMDLRRLKNEPLGPIADS